MLLTSNEFNKMTKLKKSTLVGRFNDLKRRGYSDSKIKEELKIDDSCAREIKDIIDKAEANRSNA